ncbi:MAG: DNA polymerase IV [Deltaproteobacteria bacterium]|nr:DNA polymerase IV [Deltaproteobacteria bacterium]
MSQRRIIHLDMDAFYAAIEQRDFPELRGKPLIVGGDRARGVVSTASYEARPYGVHSAMPMAQALKLCPHAIVVPPRREAYLEASRHVFTILRSFTPLVEPLSLDEAFLDVTESESLFGSARTIATRIKEQIYRETQLTGSAGIASTKFIAKIASDMQKPNGLVEVRDEDVLSFLHPLPVTRLWGVGRVTAQSLATLGIRTIGDLARWPRETLVSRYGANGDHLYQLAHGIDPRSVDPNQEMKSIGEEETFSQDLDQDIEVHAALLRYAQTVARRLRSRKLMGRTITVKIKTAERLGEGRFRLYTRSHTLPAPTSDAQEIYHAAVALFAAVPRRGQKVRLAGIYASNIETEPTTQQLSLFAPPTHQNDKRQQLGKLIDQLTTRYGKNAIRLGETPNSSTSRKVDPGAFKREEIFEPLTDGKKGR